MFCLLLWWQAIGWIKQRSSWAPEVMTHQCLDTSLHMIYSAIRKIGNEKKLVTANFAYSFVFFCCLISPLVSASVRSDDKVWVCFWKFFSCGFSRCGCMGRIWEQSNSTFFNTLWMWIQWTDWKHTWKKVLRFAFSSRFELIPDLDLCKCNKWQTNFPWINTFK